MTTRPDTPDDAVAALLRDYAAPTADDGFSDAVLLRAVKLGATSQPDLPLASGAGWRVALTAAALGFAAFPVAKSFGGWIGKATAAAIEAASASAAHLPGSAADWPIWAVPVAVIVAAALWLALDDALV